MGSRLAVFEDSGWRERGAGLLLAAAVELGIVLLLLWFLVPSLNRREESVPMRVIGVELAGNTERSETSKAEKADRQAGKTAAKAEPAVRPPPPSDPEPVDIAPAGPSAFVRLTRSEYRGGDIANAPAAAADAGPTGGGARAGDSDAAGGKGPRGETLYAAEWYRRPTQAQLDPYLPKGWAREGVGIIACRTAPRYRVEDCRIVDQAPRGSGYGNAVLQAAWQFQVRPPRVNGVDMVGAWVTIRIDYTLIRK